MQKDALDLPSHDDLLGCLCLQLRQLTRLVTQIYERALEPVDLTCNQFSVLAILHNRSGLSVAQLADLLVMDPTTTTRLLQPLERRGLVTLAPSQEDRRRRLLQTTPSGSGLFVEAIPHWRKARAGVERLLGTAQAGRLAAVLEGSVSELVHR